MFWTLGAMVFELHSFTGYTAEVHVPQCLGAQAEAAAQPLFLFVRNVRVMLVSPVLAL